MRTRQKSRKALTLPGRCFTGRGQPVAVRLSDVSEGGCRFAASTLNLKQGAFVQLFVGAAGPFAATIKWASDGEVGATFTQPLDPAMLTSLQNSHVPDGADLPPTGAAVEPPAMIARRFC